MVKYATMESLNATGMNGILSVASTAVPILPGLILFALFIIITMGSYWAETRRKGRGDLPASMAGAGFVTCVVAFLMSMIPNFITNVTIVPCVILEILFVFFLLGSRD